MAAINGCRWCGHPQANHGIACTWPPGWHHYTEPTEAQLQERAKALIAQAWADNATSTMEDR